MQRRPLLVALFLAALSLRMPLVGIGPLLPSIQSGLGISHAVAGLLGTIPVLCMGLFAPATPFLTRRLGTRWGIAFSLMAIGVFGGVRAIAPGAAGVVLLTIPMGIGMGLANAVLPVSVKQRFADRPGFATGIYTTGIVTGATIAALVAVPIAQAAGTWRAPLLAFAAVSIVLAGVWLWLTRTEETHVRVEARPLRMPLHSQLAWRMVAAFVTVSFVFYGLNAWLPETYVDHGWSQSSAGALLGVINAISIPCGFLAAWGADHWGSIRAWLCGFGALQCASLLGVIFAPGAGWLWAVTLGISIGPLFPLTMRLPLDAARRPAEVAALTGMMLGFGYSLAACSPLVLGAISDTAGGFGAVLWVLAAASASLVIVDSSFSRKRLAAAHVGGRSS